MSLLIPAGWGQANLIWQAIGAIRPCEVTIGYKDAALGTAVEQAQRIRNVMNTAGNPGAAGTMNNSWSFLGVRCMLQTESGPTVGEFFTTVVGTLGSSPPPSNCTILVRKQTASGGRANRGRMFPPPTNLSETNVDQNGVIQAATVTANQNSWNSVVSALSLDDISLYLFHTSDPIPTPITALSVQSTIATQRRRLR